MAHHRLLEDPGAMLQAQRVLQAAPKERTTSKTVLVSMFVYKSSPILVKLWVLCRNLPLARAVPHFVTPLLPQPFLNSWQRRYGRNHALLLS